MLMKFLDSINVSSNPISFDIELFIKTNFSKFKELFVRNKLDVDCFIVFDNSNLKTNEFAININDKITFNTYIIKKYLAILDSEQAQKTFLIILTIHELLHSLIKKEDNMSRDKYEYLINFRSILFMHNRTEFKFSILNNNLNKLNDKYKFNSKTFNALKNILLFPIGEEKYFG